MTSCRPLTAQAPTLNPNLDGYQASKRQTRQLRQEIEDLHLAHEAHLEEQRRKFEGEVDRNTRQSERLEAAARSESYNLSNSMVEKAATQNPPSAPPTPPNSPTRPIRDRTRS